MLTVTVGAVAGAVTAKADQIGQNQMADLTTNLAGRYSSTVHDQLSEALSTTGELARVLATLHKRGGLTRESASALIRQSIESHPSFVGASTGWEPNAFDGDDAAWVNAPESDATGRMLTYWYRDGAGVAVTPLVDYADPAVATWYFLPKNSGAPVMTEPYVYPINGVDVLMTTAASPIMIDGHFVGVVTADIDLSGLTGTLGGIRPYKTGYVSLLTNVGTVVTLTSPPPSPRHPRRPSRLVR